jgi:hypothetical protein
MTPFHIWFVRRTDLCELAGWVPGRTGTLVDLAGASYRSFAVSTRLAEWITIVGAVCKLASRYRRRSDATQRVFGSRVSAEAVWVAA